MTSPDHVPPVILSTSRTGRHPLHPPFICSFICLHGLLQFHSLPMIPLLRLITLSYSSFSDKISPFSSLGKDLSTVNLTWDLLVSLTSLPPSLTYWLSSQVAFTSSSTSPGLYPWLNYTNPFPLYHHLLLNLTLIGLPPSLTYWLRSQFAFMSSSTSPGLYPWSDHTNPFSFYHHSLLRRPFRLRTGTNRNLRYKSPVPSGLICDLFTVDYILKT